MYAQAGGVPKLESDEIDLVSSPYPRLTDDFLRTKLTDCLYLT
jgi:hypothetical protein